MFRFFLQMDVQRIYIYVYIYIYEDEFYARFISLKNQIC